MLKRSRSRSLDPEEPSSSATPTGPEELSTHTPKYFRGSKSPSPPSSTSESVELKPMQCALPPHAPLTLPSVAAFDIHYAQEHTNRCTECNANLPSAWILELHLNERHNPLIAAQRDREEKTYKCFLADCDKVTMTPEKRRLHLIDKHGYPRNYDFKMVERGIDKRPSVLRGARAAPANSRRRRMSEAGESHWQTQGRSKGSKSQYVQRNGRHAGRGRKESLIGTTTEENGRASVASESRRESGSVNPKEPAKTLQDEPKASDSKDASDEIDALASGLSALQFVPLSVRLKDRAKN